MNYCYCHLATMGAETYSVGGMTWHRIQAVLSRFRILQYDNSGNRNNRAHDRPGREEKVWLPASAVGGAFADNRGLEEQEVGRVKSFF